MEANEYGVIEATVDGVKLKNLEQYRTQSGFFNITIPEDNIYDNGAGTFRALSDGFFVFLEPLPPGKHDVHLKVSVLNPIEQQYNYNADWTYHLIIAKPQIQPSNNSSKQSLFTVFAFVVIIRYSLIVNIQTKIQYISIHTFCIISIYFLLIIICLLLSGQ